MTFIVLGIFFSGYQLAWYGWCTLRGGTDATNGIGFVQLLKPSEVPTVQEWLDTDLSGSSASKKTVSTGAGTSMGSGDGSDALGGGSVPAIDKLPPNLSKTAKRVAGLKPMKY